VALEFVEAERDHLGGRIDLAEQRARRLVDADVGRLRGQGDRYDERVRIDEFEFGLRVRIGLGQTRVERDDVRLFHSPSTSPIR